MLARILVLVRIALANITSSLLNVFVGVVLLFGAALLVIGGSLFATLDGALNRSIVDSITGHLQVYGARSKDPLEVYGKVDGSDSNLAPLEGFKELKAKLLKVPNVKTVVPMGAATTLPSSSTTVEANLERLRSLYRNQSDPEKKLPDEVFAERSKSLVAHTRHIVDIIAKDLARAEELSVANDEAPAEKKALAEAAAPEFWERFDDDPFTHLEFLENRIAPLMGDADMLFLRVLGTDLSLYQSTFSRMAVVEGTPVPDGHRGLLLPRFFYEEFFKLKSARRLDKMKQARESGRKLDDVSDKELQRFKRENMAQTREFGLQLDSIGTAAMVAKLQGHLGVQTSELAPLLSSFFDVNDANFQARYDFFYQELAPLLTLYRVKVGDRVALRSFGRSGSVETCVVKLYGIFEFRGLEKSPLAGANALVDMLTFRDLYGFLTPEKKAELDAMRAQSQAKAIAREDAEDALFGGGGEVVEEVQAAVVEAPAPTQAKERAKRTETFDVAAIDDGVVLNAAIILADDSPLAQRQTRVAIEQMLGEGRPPVGAPTLDAAEQLSKKVPFTLAGPLGSVLELERRRAKGESVPTADALLGLQAALKTERAGLSADAIDTVQRLLAEARPGAWVVGWDSAAGFLGNFIQFFRGILAAIVTAFAFIALIVVTIGMTIATLQRTATIGTMRAIGAQRSFVVLMVLVETVVLAIVFGTAGTILGSLVVAYLHAVGIPAFRDELFFFFSGPVLRPELTALGVGLAFGVTLVVSLIAVLVPTVMATRVAPVTAMRGSE